MLINLYNKITRSNENKNDNFDKYNNNEEIKRMSASTKTSESIRKRMQGTYLEKKFK